MTFIKMYFFWIPGMTPVIDARDMKLIDGNFQILDLLNKMGKAKDVKINWFSVAIDNILGS